MFSIIKKLDSKYPYVSVLFIMMMFSILLTLPQLWDKGVVLGADFLFHYNRFYETAMQIKEGNFSYFISLYSFQESGRIINALYGPAFAYFQGLLVLLSGTWFNYQVLSKILLGTLAGFSLNQLLSTVGIRKSIRLPLSLLFITTSAIQYWWMVQGFSSWGAALFPLCFIPAVKVLQTGKIDKIYLGGSVALMAQVHVLSTFFLVISYLPCFLYVWWKSKEKWHFISDGLIAVGIYFLLTPNIILPLVELYATNSLKAPFVNQDLAKESTTWLKWTYLVTPLPLIVILLGNLWGLLKTGNKGTEIFKLVGLTYLIFLVASTNIFPWQLFEGRGVGIVDLIQFPFRFFFYSIALLFLLVGLQLMTVTTTWQKRGIVTLFCFTLLAGGQVMYQTKSVTHLYYQGIYPEERHTVRSGTDQEIKNAFHDKELSHLLLLMQKSTPDYIPKKPINSLFTLPIPENKNYYNMYMDYIILNNKRVTKERIGSQLELSWQASEGEEVLLPIVAYKRSQLVLNGKKLDKKLLRFTALGTPLVGSKEGDNRLLLSYDIPNWLMPVFVLTTISWLIYSYFFVRQILKK